MKLKEPSLPRKWESLNSIFRFPIETYFEYAQLTFGKDISKNIIKILFLTLLIIFLNSCSTSKDFSEYENVEGKFIESGIASWYGPNFHGKKTANGEIYDMYKLTAAHRTLPFNSILRVINSENGKSIIVRINDRGPFAKNRIIDLSKKAAEEIDLIHEGTARVKLFLLSNHNPPTNTKIANYTIQVGSYKNRKDAVNFASKISNSKVVKVNINGETYYRIYAGNFISKKEANNLLKEFQRNGIDGFVKQVEN